MHPSRGALFVRIDENKDTGVKYMSGWSVRSRGFGLRSIVIISALAVLTACGAAAGSTGISGGGASGPTGPVPVFSSSLTATVMEGKTGTVYSAQASASGQTISYSLSGKDAAKFSIDPATGQVSFKSAPVFSADSGGNTYGITITATTGGKQTAAVAVTITVSRSIGVACGADALGTERTITLPRKYAAYGTAQHGPLPLLKPGEVVLTFDDGPSPGLTRKVLDALGAQCVKATFFTVGQNLRDNPAIAQQEAAEGHSVGIHSYTHPDLSKMTPAEQLADLDKTVEAYKTMFNQSPAAYRFPFLAETPTMMDALKTRDMTVLSVDLGIDDWQPADTSEMLRDRLVSRLQTSSGGIILLHDANGPTAEALPLLLKALKDGGYKVVHIEWEAP